MKVRYNPADSETEKMRVNWGGNDDPANYLVPGRIYGVRHQEIHSWHTKVILEAFPELEFNDSSFEYVLEPEVSDGARFRF